MKYACHYIQIETMQTAKVPGLPCGDVVESYRCPASTTLLCVDGIGSGFHAHIAAQMCASRFIELMKSGFSLRRTFASIATDLQKHREPDLAYAAFSVAHIRSDGVATTLTYDAPPALLIGRHAVTRLSERPFPLHGGLATESHCQLETGEGNCLFSRSGRLTYCESRSWGSLKQ